VGEPQCWAAQPKRRAAGPDRLPARPCRAPMPPMPRHGPQSLAEGVRPPAAPHCPPDGGMTALDPRLSLAPGLIRGRPLALRAAASSRASEASPAAFDHGFRSPARPRPAASFRGPGRLLVPDRDQALSFPAGSRSDAPGP
jgi:hypothetical protein